MTYEKPEDAREGDRVELSPHLDLWMRGARYGTVAQVGRKRVSVKLDKLARVLRFNPSDLYLISRTH